MQLLLIEQHMLMFFIKERMIWSFLPGKEEMWWLERFQKDKYSNLYELILKIIVLHPPYWI